MTQSIDDRRGQSWFPRYEVEHLIRQWFLLGMMAGISFVGAGVGVIWFAYSKGWL